MTTSRPGHRGAVGADEFDDEAAAIADELDRADLDERIAAACRGSGSPAALAWLAEGLRLGPGQRVVDLGSGLGGPAAWLERRYRCRVVAAEPAAGAVTAAAALFATPAVRSIADAAPFRDGSFDAAVVLGVVSVVPDAVAVLREAARVATGLGVLEWCSTEPGAVAAGGSRFPTPDELARWIDTAGWAVARTAPLELPVPPSWQEAADAADVEEPSPDRAEVEAAIEAGRLRVQLVLAERR